MEKNKFAAGVVPYLIIENQYYFLLGLERSNNKWSGFVGKSEIGETPQETALREFNEETSLLFKNNLQFVYSKLNLTEPVLETTPSGNVAYIWFIHFPPHIISMDFSEFHFNQSKIKDRHFKEKSNLRWFTLSQIRNGPILNCLKQTILRTF